MTDPLADLRRADAHARWRTADHLALRPEAASHLASAPAHFAGWMDDEEEEDDEEPGYEVEDGVAIVPIEGALMDRACWWWDGYDAILARVSAALADPQVRAVMLDMDSPGGMVAGLFDAMRGIRAAKAVAGKRVVAWVGSGAYSAAYGLASCADEIVTSDTAGTGSVGVITSLYSFAKELRDAGVDVRVISSGEEKKDGHPAVPITDDAEARATARVAELAAMLFDEVRAGRPGLTTEALSALGGGVRFGRAALAAGLADRVSTRAALLDELKAQRAPTAPMRGTTTGATRATRKNMDETLIAALSAATGETDPDAALRSLLAKHESARAAVEKLSADVASANERAAAAEKRVAEIERGAEIEAAKAAGQWSPALDGFLATLSVEQLRAWRANAPRIVPQGEVKPPSDAPHADAQALPAEIARIVEKASAHGWSALTGAEKSTVTRHSRDLANSLRGKGR